MNNVLLGRSAIVLITSTEITLYLEDLHEYRDQAHVQALMNVFDDEAIMLAVRTLRLHLWKPQGAR